MQGLLSVATTSQVPNHRRTAQAGPVSHKTRLTFKLYFPRAPYNGAQYHAAFSNGLFNFVGLVLGHQGATIKEIQQESCCRVELHDNHGNLNGDHPSPADPSLHAIVMADSKVRSLVLAGQKR
jgi:hypothetical protein